MTIQEREQLVERMTWLAQRIYAGHPKEERPAEADCPICGNVVTGPKIHRDHNHETGNFRGWLCRDCNLGLGRFKDNSAVLRRAALYLEVTAKEGTPLDTYLLRKAMVVG